MAIHFVPWKKKGWLWELLKVEGLADGTKQNKKEQCWSYYKSQSLYIEALQDAKDDVDYDPRRNNHKIGKDGRFVTSKKGTDKPKNPLTVTYLCFAFAVPYATFKRWKADAFVTKKFQPAHKGKSILTDKVWAGQVFNARRMYVKHTMAVWLDKHPAKKYDVAARKVDILFRFNQNTNPYGSVITRLAQSSSFCSALGKKSGAEGEMEDTYRKRKTPL